MADQFPHLTTSKTKTPKSPKALLSKLFRSKSVSGADAHDDIRSDDPISIAERPLIQQDLIKKHGSMQAASFGGLIDKAKTMSPEEFRKYLKEHREVEEAKYRKMGGGIAGGGDWVYRGEKDQRGGFVA